mmetsp:Transcript_85093/g.241175  ORF Transcript_85093/g.241175 Transcript_85093/m.241175 type:complete len:87 (+) Transcript_85093:282-542(+)
MYIGESYSWAKDRSALIRDGETKIQSFRNPMFRGPRNPFKRSTSNPTTNSRNDSTERKTASSDVDVEDIYGRGGSELGGIELQGRS